MAIFMGLLPYIGPLIGWVIVNILKNKAMADEWQKNYMGWLKFDQNQIPIAATEKNNVRAQIAAIQRMREERKKAEQPK